MRSTLKDIAKLTGLSVSGVSRALKGHPDISAETKEKVLEVAKALNYHPNPNAQVLRTKSSKIIAAILPEVNTFFFPEVLQGISKVVEENGYFLIFLQSDNSLRKEMELIDYCLRMFVDGVLISVSAETTDASHLVRLKETGTAVMMIDRVLENTEIPYLTIDDKAASFQAVSYLVQKGHRHILGVFDDPRLSMCQLRATGFRSALQHHGLPFSEPHILMCSQEETIEDEITKLLDEHQGATAIFTMSDKLMVKASHVLNCLGFKIPSDVALISISDGKAPHYLFPGITHIQHSGEMVGSAAAKLLFDMLVGKEVPPINHVPTQLVALGSV